MAHIVGCVKFPALMARSIFCLWVCVFLFQMIFVYIVGSSVRSWRELLRCPVT